MKRYERVALRRMVAGFGLALYLAMRSDAGNGMLWPLWMAALALMIGGIVAAKVEDESDAIIKRAIVCYVKAEFGLDNPDAAKYRDSYEMLKRHLQLSNEYTREA